MVGVCSTLELHANHNNIVIIVLNVACTVPQNDVCNNHEDEDLKYYLSITTCPPPWFIFFVHFPLFKTILMNFGPKCAKRGHMTESFLNFEKREICFGFRSTTFGFVP